MKIDISFYLIIFFLSYTHYDGNSLFFSHLMFLFSFFFCIIFYTLIFSFLSFCSFPLSFPIVLTSLFLSFKFTLVSFNSHSFSHTLFYVDHTLLLSSLDFYKCAQVSQLVRHPSRIRNMISWWHFGSLRSWSQWACSNYVCLLLSHVLMLHLLFNLDALVYSIF